MTCIFIIHLKLDNFYLERKYIALFSISRSLTRTFLTYFLYSCNLVYVNMKEHDISHLKWNVGACWFMVEIQSPGQIRLNIVKELVISHYIDTPRWWNNIPQYSDYLRIDRNLCSVHEEIAQSGCTHHVTRAFTQGCVQPDWGYFEWTEKIISINPYELIQTFFVMILINIFFFSK